MNEPVLVERNNDGVEVRDSDYVIVRDCRNVVVIGCADVKLEANEVIETDGNNRFPDGSVR